MARQTRAQRRARRARANVDAADGKAALPSSAPPPAPARRAAARPERAEPERDRERHVPGEGAKNFVGESWGELKKVEWPTQNQVIQATAVVLIACAIVGVYLWGADLVFKRLVENVFLGH